MRLTLTTMLLLAPALRTFAAEGDPASLERLADIETLPPVPWWPPAPGWYLLMAAVLVLAVSALVAVWRRRQRNAYRSAALAELDRLARGPEDLSRIAQVLKRTAMVSMPRQRIAGLSGEPWLHWLQQTGNGVSFSARSRQLLGETLYGPGRPDEREIDKLAETARAWVRRHQVNPTATIEQNGGSG